jgi:hypothetical protein
MAKTPLTRDRAWAYILLNMSVPGWGSLKAGRRFEGYGKMIIGLGGLLLLVMWLFAWAARVAQSEIDDTMPTPPPNWLWKAGVGLIVVSWIWTLVTSISLMREAKAQEKEDSQNVPPRLSDLPKPPKLS